MTVETRLSRARRLAPTGTSTTRSASSCACSTRVFGCVDVVVDAVRRLAVVRRVAVAFRWAVGLRAPEVVLLVVAMSRCCSLTMLEREKLIEHVFVNRPADFVTLFFETPHAAAAESERTEP